MDDILGILFGELCQRIKECQEKNPFIDMSDIERSCLLIQSYVKKPLPVKDEATSLPYMSYEELCKLTRAPRVTPKGHLGPSYTMICYAEENDNRRARQMDKIIQDLKELDKKYPFF